MKKMNGLSQINSVFSRLCACWGSFFDNNCRILRELTLKVLSLSLAGLLVFTVSVPSYADLSEQTEAEVESELSDLPSEEIIEIKVVKESVEVTPEDIAVVRDLVEVVAEQQITRAVEKTIEDSKKTDTPIYLSEVEKTNIIKRLTEATVTYMFQIGLFKDEISRIITHKLPLTAATAVIVSTTTFAAGTLVSLVMPVLGATIVAIPFGAVTVAGLLPFETFSRWLKSKKKYGYSYTQLDRFNNVYMGYSNNNDLSYYSVATKESQLVLPVENNVLKLSKSAFYSSFISKVEFVKTRYFKGEVEALDASAMAILNRKVLVKILGNDKKRRVLLKKSKGNVPIYHGLLIAEIQKNEDKFKELVRYSVDNYMGESTEARELILKIKVLKQRMKIVLEKTSVSKLTIPLRLQRAGLLKFEKSGLRSDIRSHIKKRKALLNEYNQLIALTYDALYAAKLNDSVALEAATESFVKAKSGSLILIPETISGYRLATNKKREVVEATKAESGLAPSCAISLLGH